MAMDEYLFEQVISGRERCCLRLYSWEPGGITFGLNQNEQRAFDQEQIGDTPAIRRVTGGRAIYHDPDEMTYCFAANLNSFASGEKEVTSNEMFRQIAEALVIWLKRLDIDAEFARQSADSETSPVKNRTASCFSSHSRFEILGGGRKIIASAQRVIGRTIMQHGSIKWHGLAPHPALETGNIAGWQEADLQQLTAQFMDLSGVKLRSVFSEQFDLFFDDYGIDEDVEREISERVRRIENDPLGRRELIEQNE